MKKAFFDCIWDIAKDNPEFIFIKGDTAYIPDYQKEYPDQYLDVGIAEQNMVGVAAGMALEGRIPFTYSIVNFATMRCLEQIRNDIAYHNLNVKVISCGQGFDYGPLGATHHATEDIAIMRSMPDMKVMNPCDAYETRACVWAAYNTPGPFFIRNGHGGEPLIHKGELSDFKIGKAYKIIDGKDIVILASGSIVGEAVAASKALQLDGYDVGVYSFPTIKPLDDELIRELACESRIIITLEEHTIIGGFGSAVSEVIAETEDVKARFRRVGIEDTFAHEMGSREHLKNYYGIDSEKIVEKIKKLSE